jgi:hypothetical protein
VTESRDLSTVPAETAAPVPAEPATTPTPPAAPAETSGDAESALAIAPMPALALGNRHPNLGLAPISRTAGYPAAAEKLQADMLRISAAALEAAVKTDPTIKARYNEADLRRLLRDDELLVERLSMCLASDTTRWLAEYAEWICPIYRRRGVSLGDLAAACEGIRETVAPMLSTEELEVATRSLEAAIEVFKRNSRLGGDRHKRNALWKWMYRGV